MLLELYGRNRGWGLSNNRKRPLLKFGNIRLELDDAEARAAAVRRTAILACRHYAGALPTEPASVGASSVRWKSRI